MPKVLIFESDESFAGELSQGLMQHHCNVTVVGDATEGLQVAASDRPDLVLLTVELPRINGFSVCNKLKRDPGLKGVPLIIMSSDSDEETFNQHRSLKHSRAEDYVKKPVSFSDLLPRISALLPLASDESMIDSESESSETRDSYLDVDDDLEDDEIEPISVQEIDELVASEPVDEEVDEFTEAAFDNIFDDRGPPQLIEDASANDDPDTKVDARSTFREDSTGDTDIVAMVPEGPVSPRTASAPVLVPGSLPPDAHPTRLSESRALAALNPESLAEKDRIIGELRQRLLEAQGSEVESAPDLSSELERSQAEAEQRRLELASVQGEVEALRRELESAHRETQNARAQSQPARSDAAREAAATAGGHAREILSLRQALNEKDKEILELQSQVTHKSKELVAARDVSLGYEREKTEVNDKLLEVERQLHETRRSEEAARADKAQAAKRGDDFKRRVDKLSTELEQKEAERQSLGATIDELKQSHSLALEEAEKQALSRSEAAATTARGEAEQAAAERLEEEQGIAERAKNQALEHQEARLKTEYEQAFATLVEEKEGRCRELEEARDEATARAAEEAESAQATMDVLQGKIASLEEEVSRQQEAVAAGQTELATSQAALAAVQTELSSCQSDLIDVRAGADATSAQLEELRAELTAARAQHADLQTEFERVQSNANVASEKGQRDRDSAQKMRAALGAMLEQLDQIDERPAEREAPPEVHDSPDQAQNPSVQE